MQYLEGNRTGSEHSKYKGPGVGLFVVHLRSNQGEVRWLKWGEWGTSWGGEGGEFAQCGYTGSLGSNRGHTDRESEAPEPAGSLAAGTSRADMPPQ